MLSIIKKINSEWVFKKVVGSFLKQKQKMNEETYQSKPRRPEHVLSRNFDSSSEDEPLRMTRAEPWMQANINDFKVEIPEFESKLDPKEYLDWLHTIKRVFEY